MDALRQPRDLFSPNGDSVAALWQDAFDAWVAQRSVPLQESGVSRRARRPLSAASVQTYRHMFEPFKAHCAALAILPDELVVADLQGFLDARESRLSTASRRSDISARHAFRLLALVQKVVDAGAAAQLFAANRAAAELLNQDPYKTVNTHDKAGRPAVLRAAEAVRLTRLCLLPMSDALLAPKHWRDVRDNTAVMLQLGGGVTPGEISRLRCEDVREQDGALWLSLPKNGTIAARETPLSVAARRQLRYWLRVRQHHGVRSEYLLPADDGTAWTKFCVYRAVARLMAAAGLSAAGGSYRLRHTFILRQLKGPEPKPAAKVAQWVGIAHVDEMVERYRPLLFDPDERVH